MKVRLDHVGIAVADAAAAVEWYRTALGLEVAHAEEVASQQVRAHFLPTGTAMLELLESTAPGSPIARFLEPGGAPGCTTSPWRSTTSTPRWPSCGRPACGWSTRRRGPAPKARWSPSSTRRRRRASWSS